MQLNREQIGARNQYHAIFYGSISIAIARTQSNYNH